MAVWPVDLPQYPHGPVTTELQDSRIRSQPDTGPPLMRRRYTSAIRNVEAPMILTGAELAIFDAFYETDLLHGTLRFQWIDFRTDELVQYRFVEPPKWTTLHGDQSPANRRWQATFKLEILPGLFAGVVRNIAATLVGEAVLTARAGRLLSVSASLMGSSSLTAAPGEFLSEYVAATLTGNSEMTAAARATRGIAATLTGQATLTAGAELVQGGTVNAVELDGVGQHYVMDPLGTLAPAAGSGHTIHIWRKKAVDGVEQALYWRGDITTASPVPEVSIVVRADNKVHAEWYDESGNLIGQVTSAGTFLVADGKVPIGLDISGDTATLRLKAIDDGVNAPPTAAGGYMGFGGRRYLGRSGDDSNPRYFEGCLGEDWEAPVSLGFDDDDIYEKFVDTTLTAGLAPRSLGSDGSGPSDQVLVYLNLGYAAYHQNQAPATGSVDYVPVGFIQPCADSFGVYSAALGAFVMPSIVAGSISNATFATASAAGRTYFTGYTAGAGSNRKVIVFFALEDTEASTISETCTWGGVAGRSIHYMRRDSTTDAQIIGYEWDEGFFPAGATGDIIMDATNNEALSATVFTVKDACQGPFLDFITGVGADTSPATLDLTTSFDDSLLLTALVIGEEITDVAATGAGHTIVDNYDSNNGERIVIGKVDAAAAGAYTLGYTFTNSFHVAVSFAIAPVGAYTPFTVHPAVGTGFASAATAHAVAMPATVNAGDLLLVFLEFFWLATNPAGAITTPAGWSLVKAVDSVNGTNSRTLAMYKIDAAGTEGGTTVDFVTASNATAAALCLRIDAANWSSTLADIEAGTASNATNTSTPNPPSITPSWGPERALAIEVIGAVDDDVPMRLPSNGTSGAAYFGKATRVSGAGANAGASISIAYRMFTAASEDPGAVFIDTADDCTSQTIVVRKAA